MQQMIWWTSSQMDLGIPLHFATPRENEWIRRLRDIVLKNLDPEKFAVFIYGSRAAGTSVRSSDIDIGIWGDEPVALSVLARMREEIDESDIPYHYDIVDFSRVDDSFKAIALQHIILWNKTTFFAGK